MKIVFFTYLLLEYGGGVSTYFTTVASGLKNKYSNNEITILTFDKKLLYLILFIYSLYFTKKSDYNFKKETSKLKDVHYQKLNNIFSVIKTFKENDVLYTTNNLLELIVLKIVSFFTRLPPVIVGFHIPIQYYQTPSLQSRLHNIIYSSKEYTYLLRNAQVFHVINQHDYRLLKQLFPAKKIHLVYNPVLIEKAIKTPRHLSKLNRKKINLLWLGRITEQKGVIDLKQLISKINMTSLKDKIIWNIVGSGDMEYDVKTLAKQHKNVSYYGYIENKFTHYFYKNSDIFISTSKWESFPYTILEAQFFGLPVICYDIPGNRDIVENQKTGYIVNSIEEFQKKILYCIKKNTFQKQYIKKVFKQKFDNKILYKKTFTFLKSVV